jgi:hypothetical protein
MTPEEIRALRRDIAKRQLLLGQDPGLMFSEPIMRREVPELVYKRHDDARVRSTETNGEVEDGELTEREDAIFTATFELMLENKAEVEREVSVLRRRVRQLDRRLCALEERGIIDLPALPKS